ncbi:MAG: prepilin-type N-terminal cleavage/methylation domain-containing protein [bacterium]|nr:prepilin-type N-terminal cleavage/methylation domain-containing protein [bacterium]
MFKMIKNDKGVSFVELLIAAAILSIGVVVLVYSLNRFSESTVFCNNIKSAHDLALDLLEEIRTKKFDEKEFSWPLGPEGEYLPRKNYDDVDDYDGLVDFPIKDSGGNKIEGYPSFSRLVTVSYIDEWFREVPSGTKTSFKLIRVEVKWKQNIGENKEKTVTLSCVKARDTVVEAKGWDFLLFGDDNLSVTNAKITGNIHSNKNAYLEGCRVYGDITAKGCIKPINPPGNGSRQEDACSISMPTMATPIILSPEKPNLNLCKFEKPELSNLPYEISLDYYKSLAEASGTYYDGNINYKTKIKGKEVFKILKDGGFLNSVIFAEGNITIGSDWWKSEKTELRIGEKGALIAKGSIGRWENSYSVIGYYPRKRNEETGRYHVTLVGVNGIKLDGSAVLKGTFFSKRDIDFSPYGKGAIYLEGDVRTLKNIRTDQGGKVYGGENIRIVNSILHAEEACMLHRIGCLTNVDIRSSGKAKTRADWRDSYVEAGIFLCSNGIVRGNLYAEEDIVFVSGGKNRFEVDDISADVGSIIRSKKNILTFNSHLGRGFTSRSFNNKLHAEEAVWINNMTYKIEGSIKSLGKRKAEYSWRDGKVEAGFLVCGGGERISATIDCQEDIYFISGDKSSIRLDGGDIITKGSIFAYDTHLGEGIDIVVRLHAGKACIIKNLKGNACKEIRTGGEVKTEASWSDSKVTAGVLICGGGEINGPIYSQGSIYLVPGGKDKINVKSSILSNKSIISYNTHLGRGISFAGNALNNYYAGGEFKVSNLISSDKKVTFNGLVKACGDIELKGDEINQIYAGIFSLNNCTIADTWGESGDYIRGCVIAKRLNINKICKIVFDKSISNKLTNK